MGSFLDKPVEEKDTHSGQGNDLLWGSSGMQGWRVEMEDAHTNVTGLEGHETKNFFAVYDGHGGSTVSTRAAVELIPVLLQQEAFTTQSSDPAALSTALRATLLSLDDIMRKDPRLDSGEDRSGATAVTALVTPTHIIIGNCGDSRAIMVSGDRVTFGSMDHKPGDQVETDRVKAAGGYLEMGRVCGNLAVSRALGDYNYKDRPDLPAEAQKISAEADMTIIPRTAEDQFLLLACDGIWDVMSNEEVALFCAQQLKAGFEPPIICERLIMNCLYKNSKDNMSATIVCMPGAPKATEGFQAPPLEKPQESSPQDAVFAAQIAQRLSGLQGAPGGLEGVSFVPSGGPLDEGSPDAGP